MKKLLCLSAAIAMSAEAAAQDVCASTDHRFRAMPRFASAVMEPPEFGETELLEGTRPASRNLVLARQPVRVAPRVRYLAEAVNLVDANGRELAHSVPLGRGAPITIWRDAEGIKHCAIGWQNGLFGGVTGDGHLRWVCLEDRDGDGAYENAWRPYSRSLGLSYSRLDMPIAPAVAALEAPPEGSEVRTSERATLSERDFARILRLAQINADRVRLDLLLEHEGYRRRIGRKDVALGSGPTEVTLSGIAVTVTPAGRGAATVSARGAFTNEDVQMMCDGSQIVIGEMSLSTQFAFPNW